MIVMFLRRATVVVVALSTLVGACVDRGTVSSPPPGPVTVDTAPVPVVPQIDTTVVVTTTSTTTTTTTQPIDYRVVYAYHATMDLDYQTSMRQLHGQCGEWHDLALLIGWTEDEWDMMLSRVLWRESRCTPDSWNGADAGLTQINQIHREWIESMGWTHPDSMFDPVKNLEFALMLYRSSGCRPWSYLTC